MILLPNITDGFYRPIGLTVAGINKELMGTCEDFEIFTNRPAVLILYIRNKTFRLPAHIIFTQGSKTDNKMFFTLKMDGFWAPQSIVGGSLELKEVPPVPASKLPVFLQKIKQIIFG